MRRYNCGWSLAELLSVVPLILPLIMVSLAKSYYLNISILGVAVKKTIWFAVLVLAISNIASATMTFQQLDDNTFSISHKVKWIGGRGQAMELVYEKAASLCIAAGYTHLELFGQESNAAGYYQSANATLTVRFYQTEGEDRIACAMKASDEYIKEATSKLKKRGYQGPATVSESADPEVNEDACTVEQITALVKAGMSEEQIKAACGQK